MNKAGYIVTILVFIVFVARLSILQLFSDKEIIFDNSTVKAFKKYPERGYIYDRNGKLLVSNQLSYDVYMTPSKMKSIDTIEVCNFFGITKEMFLNTYKKAINVSRLKPYPFVTQISANEFAYIKEKIYKYNWLSIRKNFTRYYNEKIAANVFGYVTEVSQRDINNSNYYTSGDYIGKQGLEKQYEKVLRGVKGIEYIQKDKYNRNIGSFKNGIYDTLPVKGKDIKISLDADLQKYSEKLMTHKRGSIVAIEPATGEILALVSAPTYDPFMLVGRHRSDNYRLLNSDNISKPLYDRALLALYPPGSTMKPLNGLIGLQELVISPLTTIRCNHGFHYGKNGFMKCHCPKGTRNNLRSAIYRSCNSYFAYDYLRIINRYSNVKKGINVWNNHLKSFGLGNYLGYDLPIGKAGKIPDSKTYDFKYQGRRWYSTYTISNAIGQGEILVTPIQMANVTACLANRGFYYTPHLIKEIDNKKVSVKKYNIKNYNTIEKKFYRPILRGMLDVYRHGTAKNLRVKGIEIAGKTGTVENFTRINGKRIRLIDHSIFMAFAPARNPKIAILVFIENGYWGNQYAGPIASLCIEKYLNGSVKHRKDLEEKMLNSNLEDDYLKPYDGEKIIYQ